MQLYPSALKDGDYPLPSGGVLEVRGSGLPFWLRVGPYFGPERHQLRARAVLEASILVDRNLHTGMWNVNEGRASISEDAWLKPPLPFDWNHWSVVTAVSETELLALRSSHARDDEYWALKVRSRRNRKLRLSGKL
jgi:hypothetical protein